MESMNEIAGYLTPMSEPDETNNKAQFPKDAQSKAQTHDNEETDSDDETNVTKKQSNTKSVPKAQSVPKSVPSKVPHPGKYKYIPLRLSEVERNMLNVLNNALEVCEYTDVVDVTFSHTRKSKMSRIIESLVDILSIASGLMVSNDLVQGETLLKGRSLNDNVPFFTDLFEIGRRYKIMNPSKMRNTYGKLMYILMDTESYSVKSELKINFIKPVLTVYNFLESKEALSLLQDPLLMEATSSIHNDKDEGKTKRELQGEQQRKKEATEQLLQKYSSESLTREDIQRVIDSVADNEAYYEFNAKPVEKLIAILKDSFDPNKPDDPFSLSLSGSGRGGGVVKKALGSLTSFYSGYSSSFLGGGGE
jgi:hypothetical protein